MTESPLKLVGGYGSPYSRKLRAVLRYRRIAHRWIARGSREDRNIPEVPVALIPVLVFPGEGDARDTAMIDSSFQIRRLEELQRERSVIPPEPVTALVDALIEDYADYADEWLTKAMFHYRWAFEPDVRKAAAILPRCARTDAPEEEMETLGRAFSERQIGRLAVVGSNSTTAPVIEESYRRLLRALDARLRVQPFVMGTRPGTADFGLFGQLTQLALFDPTSQALALQEAPRVVAWCHGVEDLSGLEVTDADWTPRDALPETPRALLAEVGRGLAEWRRRLSRQPHRVFYFHQADDPYRHLAAQVLASLVERHAVELIPMLTGPPPAAAAPERERLLALSREDAADIAPHYGLEFSDPGEQPERGPLRLAERILAGALDGATFASLPPRVGHALWRSDANALEALTRQHPPLEDSSAERAVAAGDEQRQRLGHYLGATFFYAGEWYWGIDRLHYLEQRQADLGVRRAGATSSRTTAGPCSRWASGGSPASV